MDILVNIFSMFRIIDGRKAQLYVTLPSPPPPPPSKPGILDHADLASAPTLPLLPQSCAGVPVQILSKPFIVNH